MTDEESLARAMAIAEVAVQQMAEEGIEPMQRAIGLAFHMNAQADIAMPTPETAKAFRAALAS
jgi:hypothetical protein